MQLPFCDVRLLPLSLNADFNLHNVFTRLLQYSPSISPIMDPRFMRPARSICLLCRVARQAQWQKQWPQAVTGTLKKKQRRHASTRAAAQGLGMGRDGHPHAQSQHKIRRLSSQDQNQVQHLADRVLKHQGIPSEADTLNALTHIDLLARQLLGLEQTTQKQKSPNKTPASTLLSLDSQPTAPPTGKAPPSENITFLTDTAFKLVAHDRVYITPAILNSYVQIQALLSRPSTLPTVFDLYRNKPTAYLTKQTSSTPAKIEYRPQNPTAISTAIPNKLADLALATAMKTKHLPTALDIISATYRDPSNRRSKLFTKALPPIAFFSLFPLACWQAASQFSTLQTALPAEDFTMCKFDLFASYYISPSSSFLLQSTLRTHTISYLV